jgi:catechol 2,3-dioxygenase-like lactoylglutathione lyase family enzyme
MAYFINGIQQIGVGNNDIYKTYQWYEKNFGTDVKVFDESAEAALMLPYTGGVPRKRHAILAMNMNGGGGVEIWQYTERRAVPPKENIAWGDYGILASCFKSWDIEATHKQMDSSIFKTEISTNPAGQKHFYTKDLHGNLIEVLAYDSWFKKKKHRTGGVCGAVIGVSDMDKSLDFYKNILKYDVVLSDETAVFEDFRPLISDGSEPKFRRVILSHSAERKGAFSELFGKVQLELIQRVGYKGKRSFEGRLWGDLGYIHLCYDVNNMDALKSFSASKGYSFTVDSGDFEMGNAAGRFAYVEDPDGTLIEFVETYEVPIVEKLGWSIKLKGKKRKPLPRFIINAMGWF